MGFGDLIRQQRDRQGLTQGQLAEIAGVSFSVISRMERGETIGRADTIARVTSALHLDAALVQRYLSDGMTPQEPVVPSLLSVALQMKTQLDDLIATLEKQQAEATRRGMLAQRDPSQTEDPGSFRRQFRPTVAGHTR